MEKRELTSEEERTRLVAAYLRKVRKLTGLSLAEVAARIDPPIKVKDLEKIESGSRIAGFGLLLRIAEAIGVPREDVIEIWRNPSLRCEDIPVDPESYEELCRLLEEHRFIPPDA